MHDLLPDQSNVSCLLRDADKITKTAIVHNPNTNLTGLLAPPRVEDALSHRYSHKATVVQC